MEINIENRKIGKDQPVFIVADLSANHLRNYDLTIKTIKAIKESGADAVKFQTYTPDTLTIDSEEEFFQIKHGTLWDGCNLYKLYKDIYMPLEWQPKLKKIAEDLGLICFSTPTDKSTVDFLEEMNVPVYKISSFEITDIPFIEYVASKKKPVIISTGIATLSDIEKAISSCKKWGNHSIALLKCSSSYPTPLEEINLKTIPDMERRFNTIVGLSDHTFSISSSLGAVALGAKIIEKHFILDKNLNSPDAAFSLNPEEFTFLVKSIRELEKELGEISYELTERLKLNKTSFSRSLFIVKDMKKGEVFTHENIKSIRPGYGLSPEFINEIIGKKSKRELYKGQPLTWDMIE